MKLKNNREQKRETSKSNKKCVFLPTPYLHHIITYAVYSS